MDKSKTKMFCFFCSKNLTMERSNLEEHGAKHAHEIEEPSCINTMVHNLPPTVYPVTQSLQTKKFWSTYNPDVMVTKHNQISAPASLIDPTGELIFLTKNIFTKDEILTMTTEAGWLDTFAKPTKRGVHKGGSRMVTFGIRYKYGKLAW
jgi:hypothetical protein